MTAARRVIEMELVLDARIACTGVTWREGEEGSQVERMELLVLEGPGSPARG